MEKIWFVTGAGHGFGLALVKQLLKQGHKVAAVAENIQSLRKMSNAGSKNLLMLEIALCDEDSVSRAAYDAVRHFGRLDIVINADKEGIAGNIEELSDEEIRHNFEVNIFSGLNVVRATLPYLKEQRSGHIFNLSSLGRMSGAGLGIYRATELAMIAILESLAVEVQSFGIDVTIMTPGSTPSDLSMRTIQTSATRRIEDHQSAIRQILSCMQNFRTVPGGGAAPLEVSHPLLPNVLFAV
ncbi:SDR family NAD(P)-dependent oxidoreductase [Terrimonas sp. NA20]|uniref:SDR family NAD(P)-dependent oxidoreductase n=1 Tax=Terrimonas ginsenosidimutans TaxID=2908004 RepID=A0ABS9KKR5_9BACT|nr:SDR family NAD(P)-dependent oxidoreductase [Terrimonas ginsenosidimutans]MCG2612855.1 SDR family NAD(P)-dependent oxidoreductase [Terrimonas ginsenosidimutans]